ncbi:MAG: hypothetical protein LRZ85_00055 [Alphaproteobacteria bacterium]|nr:hypothetical protein [Alphaproteobacteria bacterium]MCD8526560.1 hypothetical protein [Alphaproteobacteria bacterium]MCD8571326.1 hypothetical protein [Alphaproteobacteria bacterium]
MTLEKDAFLHPIQGPQSKQDATKTTQVDNTNKPFRTGDPLTGGQLNPNIFGPDFRLSTALGAAAGLVLAAGLVVGLVQEYQKKPVTEPAQPTISEPQ